MATVVAGATHAPITAILIIFEMTNDYKIILPLMVAAAMSTFVASRLFKESIYTLKLARRGINIRHGREVNILASMSVREVMDAPKVTIPSTMPLVEVLETLTRTRDDAFPVVDRQGRLTGVISYSDLRDVVRERWSEDTKYLIIAQDVATTHPVTITPDANLNEAMKKFGIWDMEQLPVVDAKDSNRLVGILRRRDVINAYNRALMTGERA
jgi:CIC family chloride channel protein